MTVSIFGRKIQLVWLAYWFFLSAWFFWKGILLFSIVAFAPAVLLDFYLKKAGCGRILRTLSLLSAFLLSAAIYNQLRAHF